MTLHPHLRPEPMTANTGITMSTRSDERQVTGEIMAAQEIKEAGRLLAAAGFRELKGVRAGVRVAFRGRGDYCDMAVLFADGHLEAIRQTLGSAGPLWVPGRDDPPDEVLWTATGEPLDVVHELLALPT